MTQEYFATHEIPNAKVELQHIPVIARYFHQEIVVYEVGVVRIYVAGAFYPRRGEEEYQPMTSRILKEHAFLITDLEKAAKTFVCAHCGARFTHYVNFYTIRQGAQIEKQK